MTVEELIEAAAQLPKPNAEAAAEYAARSESLAAELNRAMCAREDVKMLIGANNTEMMQDNHRNHARFMSSLCAEYHPEVLVNTVLWVFRAYRAHGFRLTYWPAQLAAWISLLERELSEPAFDSIYPLYHFMLIHQADFVRLSDEIVIADATIRHSPNGR